MQREAGICERCQPLFFARFHALENQLRCVMLKKNIVTLHKIAQTSGVPTSALIEDVPEQ
jgi:hypothetical protein